MAIFLSILVGIITALPQLLLVADSGGDYRGIAIAGTDAEEYYNIRLQEVYDGHWRVASPDLLEYKDQPYVQPAGAELVISAIGKTLGLSARQMISFGKFIFPALLYLVLYALVYVITKKKIIAIAAPIMMMLATNFVFHPSELLKIIQFKWSELGGMVDYTRPINPQFNSIVFFSWLLVFYLWLKKKRAGLFMLAAVLLGFMFYTYLYSWMLAYAMLGILIVFAIVRGKSKLDLPIIKLIIMLGLGVVISLPYWINFFQLSAHPLYDALQMRYGFYSDRAPLWSNLLFLDLILLIALFWRRVKDLNYFLIVSLILGLWVLINQQVITGLRFYPGHWHWYYTTPLSIFLAIWVIFYFTQKKLPKIAPIIAILMIVLAGVNAVSRQRNAYQIHQPNLTDQQRYAAVYQWLNQNTEPDSVVLADGQLNVKLPVYTHNNSYFSRWGEFYLVPSERFENRLLIRAYLYGTTEENIDQFINTGSKDVYELLFGRYRLRRGLCEDGCFTEAEVEPLRQMYLDFLEDDNFEVALKQYKVDYAVWDEQVDQSWELDDYNFMQLITEINNVRIYRVI